MLAVTNIAYVTSYYNKMKYEYIITKEDGIITSNLINECPTDEDNGLSVTVDRDNEDVYNIKDELRNLSFFPNVFVKAYNSIIEQVNNNKVVRYKTFSVSASIIEPSTYGGATYILLGNVVYPFPYSAITKYLMQKVEKKECTSEYADNVRKIFGKLEAISGCLNVPIGSIKVTPNRESIIYNDTTSEYLVQRLLEFDEECEKLISNSLVYTVESTKALLHNDCYQFYWTPIDSKLHYRSSGIKIDEDRVSFDYCGHIFNMNIQKAARNVATEVVPKAKAYLVNRTLYSKRLSFINCSITRCDRFIQYEGDLTPKVANYLKDSYRKSTYTEVTVIDKCSLQEFIDYYKGKNVNVPQEVFEEWYKFFCSKTVIVTEDQIEEYYNAISEKKRKKRSENKEKLIFHRITDYRYDNFTMPVEESELNKLKKKGKLLLFKGKTELSSYQVRSLVALGYEIYWVRASVYDRLISIKKDSPKLLNNVKFGFDFVYSDLSAYEEKLILYSKFYKYECEPVSNGGYFYGKLMGMMKGYALQHVINLFDFETHCKLKGNNVIHQIKSNSISICDVFRDYEVKTPDALSFKADIDYITKIMGIYKALVDSVTRFLNFNYMPESVYELVCYKFLRFCTINKYQVNVNYLKKLSNNPFILFIKDE